MAYSFALPDLGEGIAEAEIVRWHVEPGQWVEEGEPLLDVETEKAVVEIPSPASGRVGPLAAAAGASVPVGAALVVIGAEGDEGVADGDAAASGAERKRVKVPPRVRRLARELGVDVERLEPAAGEALTEADVRSAASAAGAPEAPPPLRGVRGRIARRLARVQREVPAVTVVEECDFTALDAIASGFERAALLLRATSRALEDVPELNATFVEEGVVLHDRHDIGLAVQAAEGLVVPVLRDVDRRSVEDLGAEARRLVDGAAAGRLGPSELRDSTFTVTDAGRLGGLFATPLLNAPEVGLLGLHRVGERPAVHEGELAIRRMGNVSCTFDHRAVDGFQASTFLLRFVELVQRPEELAAADEGPRPRSTLGEELAAAPEPERAAIALELVRAHAAELLGEGEIDARLTFRDLGFDSRMAVELRNRLSRASGLRLPSTLLFDHPTPAAVAERILGEALGVPRERPAPIAVASRSEEPVAIVGIGCRYPGGVRSAEDLWGLVDAGVDAISEFPRDRGWDLDRLFDPDSTRPGTSYVREGGFLPDAGDFDAEFFGIGPREALAMDPQQRLLLEVAWEALEDAGIDPDSLRGSQSGVFAGLVASGYGAAGPPELEGYRLTGTTTSVASGRLAYALGLEGPAVTVDTACSSSLVALHLACQALRAGECSLALAGGAAVMATPELFVEFSRQGGLAPDGRCKSFAAAADGTAWAEGAGLLVLERLSEARRQGHAVIAVVRGSAVTQDGASNGLTAPSGPSQERAIRQALASAGVAPEEVDAVEAHGTGTELGDPIEAGALIAAYGRRHRAEPLWLGSIKSNIGHSSAAAGAAGVIKMAMAMRHGRLPRTLHVDEPTPHVEWPEGEVGLLTEAREWPRRGQPRRAGVSSFGISGTNAHAILEEPPHPRAEAGTTRSAASALAPPPAVLPLSAKTGSALRESARRLGALLDENPELELADVGFSLATTRPSFDRRAIAAAPDRQGLVAALAALAAGEDAPGLAFGTVGERRSPVFLFPGQGSQHAGMARGLLDRSPVFAQHLRACEQALAPFVEWSLLEVLRGDDDSWLERLDIVQPALFAVMTSLAALWRSLGIEPAAVVGHSQGEIAAAHVAGALSLDDAARIAALRGKAMARIAGSGGMAAVALPLGELLPRLEGFGDRLSLAALNGPASQVVAGEPEALDDFLAACDADRVRALRIAVDYAAHSSQVDALREELLAGFGPVSPRQGQVPMYSTVTGEAIEGSELDAGYWFRNLREPVRLEPVLRLLLEGRRSPAFLEISPHPVLALGVQETVDDAAADAAVLATLRRGEDDRARLALALAAAGAAGLDVDWAAVFAGASRVSLPTYPFQRKRYWAESGQGLRRDMEGAGVRESDHPFLGAAVELAAEGEEGGRLVFGGSVSLRAHPWLSDHAVAGSPLLPGAAFLEMVSHAAAQAGLDEVRELVVAKPLVVPDSAPTALQVTLGERGADGARPVSIHSRHGPEGPWTLHATGLLARAQLPPPDPQEWPPPGAEPLEVADLYERLAGAGYEYGPAFRLVSSAWRDGGGIWVEAELGPGRGLGGSPFGIDPALLDAVLHPALADLDSRPGRRVPFSFSAARFGSVATGSVLRARVEVGEERLALRAFDAEGRFVCSIDSLALRSMDAAASLSRVAWREIEPSDSAGAGAVREVVCDPGGGDRPSAARACCANLVERLREALATGPGEPVAVLTSGAVAVAPGEVPDPAQAALWGLGRSVQAEHPGRVVLLDTDGREESREAVPKAVASGEAQVALRRGRVLVPRVEPVGVAPLPPRPWRLDVVEPGSVEGVALTPASPARDLAPNEARISMRAAGVNFRDVLVALGLYPGGGEIGGEGAGVVEAVGAGISDLVPGDRVMGAFPGAFGSVAVADRRWLCPLPRGWTFAQGAAVPVAFLTAGRGLFELASLAPGERVLIHAAAGGVGQAAVQLAAEVGAEVFATASPSKWEVLRAAGIADDHIASSRDLGFRDAFLERTAGEGVDVVLNSLAGEFVDASLDLLPRGGRFVEMGKTDMRDPRLVADAHPGASYLPLDLFEADPDRIAEMFVALGARFSSGELSAPPIASWDVRCAAPPLRYLREGRNVGKAVLGLPRPLDPEATVLVTGGTGGVGASVARHLAERHGVRRLLLVSRRGPSAAGAAELKAVLERAGAEVEIAACDVAEREDLANLIQSVASDRPLGAVIHAAGLLDDGTLESMTPERIGRVFAPKVDGAWHLHELTRDLDLTHLVLFSSVAGVLGGAGQANYGAANAFLDALAEARCQQGLPATSIAWGLWEEGSGMTAHLGPADRARLRRAGHGALSTTEALELFDLALGAEWPAVVAAATDPERAAAPVVSAASTEKAALPLLDLVRAQAARVLGHDSADAIHPERSFKDLGFDSLAAVELRNRLSEATGLQFEATLVFDHPSAAELAEHLRAEMAAD